MRVTSLRGVAVGAALVALSFTRALSAQQAGRPVGLVELDGSVNPGSGDYLARAIDASEHRGFQALVIRLDTPGGMVETTRAIVKEELGSSIPIIVWIGPRGARAGSAGVFLTLAANVAAMAPATNIGAAHPVAIGPGGAQGQDETMKEKTTNDLAAWAQGIAEQRGRNAEWAARAVRESVSVHVEEALRLKVVDLIAPDIPSLLTELDGRVVQMPSGPVTLATRGAPVTKIAMTPRERFLDALGDPNVAFLLIGLGILGILAELYHPGTILPGVLGAVGLVMGLLATRTLPVRAGALALMLVGAVLIAAELFVTSWGLLAASGVACLCMGAFLLVDPSNPGFLVDRDFGVEWSMVLPIVLTVAAIVGTIIWKIAASRRQPETVGSFGLANEEGVVVDEVGPGGGRVLVHGELWAARSGQPIRTGSKVEIEKVEGLVLTVRPKEEQRS